MRTTLQEARTAEAIAGGARSLEGLAASLHQGKGALPWLVQDPASELLLQDLGRTTAQTLQEFHSLLQAIREGD
jgi:hypothetical protein